MVWAVPQRHILVATASEGGTVSVNVRMYIMRHNDIHNSPSSDREVGDWLFTVGGLVQSLSSIILAI